MCYDAAPPIPPPAGRHLTLTSRDGSTLGAYHVPTTEHRGAYHAPTIEPRGASTEPVGAHIVLLPDVNGLRPVYTALADRFTATGADVLVLDYYGRTAGARPRGDEFPDRATHAAQLRRAQILDDVAVGLDHLGEGRVYMLGFCIGGALALYAGTTLAVDGVIAFCPWHFAAGHDPALPDDFVAGITAPVLGFFGGDDQEVPAGVADLFDQHLTAAGVPHRLTVYSGQPHGFFEDDHFGEAGQEAAAADAWRQVVAFIGTGRIPERDA